MPKSQKLHGAEGALNAYQRAGYDNRRAYLQSLTDDYPAEAVFLLADIFGPSEDFDGLISALEDGDAGGDYEGLD